MQSTIRRLLSASFILLTLAPFEAQAADRKDAERGKAFAATFCAACHATGRFGASPVADAPPFRTLGQRYPLEDLAEPLAEGIQTGHPLMPEWHLDPRDVHDLLAYMATIQDRRPH